MAESAGAIALDIVMGKNTVASVVSKAMDDCKKVISDSSATIAQKIGAIGSSVEQIGGAITPVSTAVAGLGTACFKMASDFEDSMAKLSTIAGDAQTSYNGSMQSMSDAVLALSNDTGIAAGDCAEATYQAISAGVDAGKSVEFVATANKLATGGFTELTTATDTLTTAVNAYGLKTEDAIGIADKLVNTQNLGKTSVGELGASLGKIIPTAAAYGVNIDNLCTGYVKMTANGVATAESTTYMNGMLNELGKSGTTVSDILQERTGKSFGDLMADGSSLGDVLAILQQHCAENGTQFTDLWSSAEAGKAALILAKDGADGFNSTLNTMATCSGATDAAFQQMQTTSWSLNQVVNEVKNTGISLGDTLMQTLGPIISDICGKVELAIQWFNGLDDSQRELIVKIGLVVAAAGPALIIAGKGISTIGTTVGAFVKLGSGIASLVSGAIPLLSGLFTFIAANPIVLCIGAIVAAGVVLVKNWDDVCAMFSDIWGKLTGVFQSIKDKAGEIFGAMGEAIGGKMGDIKDACVNGFNSAFDFIKGIPGEAIGWGKDMISGIIDGISSMIDGVKNAVGGVADTIRGFLHFSVPDEGPLTDYESWMPDFMSGMANGITDNIPLIKDAVSGVADTMQIGVQAPAIRSTTGGGASAAASGDGGVLQQIIDLLKQIKDGGGNVEIPIYLDGRIIDDYIVDSNNRRALRSGGMA